MRYQNLIARLNNLTSSEDIVNYFKALRQDAMVWEGFVQIIDQPSLAEALSRQHQLINPGTVAVIFHDNDFEFASLGKTRASREALERMMFGYENYLLSSEPVKTLEEAGLLALALIEKRDTETGWLGIIQDIITRMKITNDGRFLTYWGTIFAAIINLVVDKEDFLRSFVNIEQPEIGVGVITHMVLCLPILDAIKADMLSQCVLPLSPSVQAVMLNHLKTMAGDPLTAIVAEKLIKKYALLEQEQKSTREYWNSPVVSMRHAFELQSVAEIAQYSGDWQLANRLNDRSLEIVSALLKLSKVKKAGIVLGEDPAMNIHELFTTEELSDTDVIKELVYTRTNVDSGITDGESPISIIKQARSMTNAGNEALAGIELRARLKLLSDDEFEQSFLRGPEHIRGWDPVDWLGVMLSSGANDDAMKLAKLLIERNPNNIAANKAAAEAAAASHDYQSSAIYLEALAVLEPGSKENQRNLAKSYIATDDNESAYNIYKNLTAAPEEAAEKDLLDFGEIALATGRPQETLGAAATLLEKNSESVFGLTLSGLALHQTGQTEKAIDELRRAVAVSDGEPKPWIELGQILWSGGDKESALTTFREGIAANPGNFTLQTIYATKLMDNGMVTEALPYLRDLSQKENDPEVDWLLIKAMKHLGMDGIEEALSVFIERHSEDFRFKGEYGEKLVWQHNVKDGLAFLQSIQEYLPQEAGWSLAYVEGLMRPDYLPLASKPLANIQVQSLARNLLDDILQREPDNLNAKLLNAEWLLGNGDFIGARSAYNELMDLSQGGKDLPLARLFTGLARSASMTGDHEIALAALEQAMSMEPEWYALQRFKAEFYESSGDGESAIKQGLGALEIASECPENHIWLLGLLAGLNAKKEYEGVLAEAIQKFPKNLSVRLIEAQQLIPNATLEESQEIEARLLSLVEEPQNSEDLVKSAVVFSSLDNPESTIACLVKAANGGSEEAKIMLSGLYRIRKEHENALATLESIQSGTPLLGLLKSEVEFDRSGLVIDDGHQIDLAVNHSYMNYEEAFLPVEWKELITSNRPGIVLRTRIAMALGQAQDLQQAVNNWVIEEPDNLEARIYAIELALACNAAEEYENLLNYEPAQDELKFARHFELLRMEHRLDSDSSILEDELEPSYIGTMSVEEPQKIALVRLLAAAGNLNDAESYFEMANAIFGTTTELPQILRIGLVRNLVKCAADLNRWSEALSLASIGRTIATNNAAMLMQTLKCHTGAQEFNNRSEDMGVVIHRAPEELFSTPAEIEEMMGTSPETGFDAMANWLARYKLAVNPTRENIRALALLTPSAEDATALMSGLRRIGQLNTAMQIAKKFTEHHGVLYEMALCVMEEDPEKAVEYLEKSLAAFPVQPLALKLRSACIRRIGHSSEAMEGLEEALSLWTNEYLWHEEAAEQWMKLGNLENPVTHLQQASLYKPEDIGLNRKLGDALFKTGNATEALKQLLIVAEKQPEQSSLWESISESHQLTGDLELAMEAAEKAVQVDPFSVSARLKAGKIRWKRGEVEKALDQVNLAISIEPENADNYVFLARIYADQGDKGKALEMLCKVPSNGAVSLQTMIEHASLLKELKGAAAARDQIASFSEQYPENPELLKLLAEAEDECGNTKKAELVARKALDIHPGEAGLQMLLGKIQAKVGNLDQAVSYFSRAIALEPKSSEAYHNLSKTYLAQRDYVKAKKVLEQGIEKIPGDVELYLTCAALLKEAKDYQGAEKMLRKASQIEPRNVNIRRQLGAVLALNLVHQTQEVSTQL